MSLPPSFLDELRDRLTLSDVIGRKVTWDTRKSNPGKGDMWAPCPFHQEKTASFHVDDRKGFYYCFGCQAKGNVYKFVQETENVGFMEAVEILAREAGMQLPARDPKAQEKIDHTKLLADVMDQAVRFYAMQLRASAGQGARDYLDRRALRPETQTRFEIGFAPPGWQNLYDYLSGRGVSDELMIEVGLVKPSDKSKKPYDTFRNRIMFPIRDARGRCIGFGGRAMDPNDNAKYLNSPETPLFDKGRSLYHYGPAREAAGKQGTVLVAEGYMDVIALAQAGFDNAVAPLGTAVTAEQLALLWRIADEPILALDGDKAGIRAAMRVIDLAMPLLEAGKGLRFVVLPEGQDPDDILKSQGREAMEALLSKAEPMVNLLWRRETEGQTFDSPERRAALDARLRDAILKIKDKSLRSHYGSAIAQLRRDLFSPTRPTQARRSERWQGKPAHATDAARASALARGTQDYSLLESTILLAALLVPQAARAHEMALERCEIQTETLRPIHQSLIAHLFSTDTAESLLTSMTESLNYDPTEVLRRPIRLQNHPYLMKDTDPEMTALTLEEALTRHAAELGHQRELAEAMEDIAQQADERLTKRLAIAAKDYDAAKRSRATAHDDTDADAATRATLDALIASEPWKKKKL